jgi:hypothetical protein
VPLDRQHTILLPSVDSILNERLYGIVYPISDMFDLPFAFHSNHLYSPTFESFSIFFQLCVICFSLCFECLLSLSNHFLEFGYLRILLLWRLIVFLACLQSFLSGFFFFLLLFNSSLLFDSLQLFLDCFSIEYSFKPFLLVTCKH